jgi:hypothetical protein
MAQMNSNAYPTKERHFDEICSVIAVRRFRYHDALSIKDSSPRSVKPERTSIALIAASFL